MSLDAADKIKIKTLLWRDYVSGIYLDTIRDINSAKSPRKSSKSSDSKNFRIFENHKLEFFSFHSFRTILLVLALHENNIRTCLTKSIFEINMCKSQYQMDLKNVEG